MPFQRVPNTAEVRIVFNVVNEEHSNYYHAEQATPYNQAGIDALAAGVDQNAGPAFAAIMSVNDAYLRTEVRGLDTEFDLFGSANTFTVAGSVVKNVLPPNLSFVIRKLSAFSGRSARGRVFICGIPDDSVQTVVDAQKNIKSANADAWSAVVDGVRIAIDNVGIWDPVIVSRWNDKAKRAEGVTFDWVITDYATLKLGTRRKRLR